MNQETVTIAKDFYNFLVSSRDKACKDCIQIRKEIADKDKEVQLAMRVAESSLSHIDAIIKTKIGCLEMQIQQLQSHIEQLEQKQSTSLINRIKHLFS